MKREVLNTVMVLILLLAAVPVMSAPTAQAADTITIGLSLPSLEDPFYAGVNNGAEAAAEDMGLELMVMAANNDPAIELANIEALLADGIDVLLISPVDVSASAVAIALANDAEVPVVLLSAPAQASVADVDIAVTVSLNDVQGGNLAGNLVCGLVASEGTVVEVIDDLASAAMQQRSAGFNDYLASKCETVAVVQFDATGMDRDTFIDGFTALLGEQAVNGVAVLNEAMTLPAIEAALIARQNNIAFVSFSSSDDALTALDQGYLKAVVLPYGWWMGEAGIEASGKLAAGETVDVAILVDLGILDLGTTVRGPGDDSDLEDPRLGSGTTLGGDGDLEGGDGDLEGGDGDLEGGDGDLEGGDGDLEGGSLRGGPGDLE